MTDKEDRIRSMLNEAAAADGILTANSELLRKRITELEAALVYKELALDKLKRKAQWVADRAYNKGVRDAMYQTEEFEFLPKLIKTPRHDKEFAKPAEKP